MPQSTPRPRYLSPETLRSLYPNLYARLDAAEAFLASEKAAWKAYQDAQVVGPNDSFYDSFGGYGYSRAARALDNAWGQEWLERIDKARHAVCDAERLIQATDRLDWMDAHPEYVPHGCAEKREDLLADIARLSR